MSQEEHLETPALSTAPAEPELQLTACWSTAGVYGDGSCAELHKFVHCRNCPVYSTAAVRLLDRPLPANYLREWGQHFAQEKRLSETGDASVILFRIQSQWLGLPTHCFQEVAEKRPLHSLPNRPGGVVLGLANVRGELVTCISLGHSLQIEGMASLESVRTEYRRLLVVHWQASKLAFPVDEVQGPNRFHPEELKSPPSTMVRANARYAQAILSWQNRAVGLLDTDLLLSSLNRSLV